MKNITKAIIILISCLSMSFYQMPRLDDDWEIRAEQIIHSYMVAKGIDIKPGTEEYQIFMRDILWGAYPELFGVSDFIKNEEEVVFVHDYAYMYSGYEEAYGKYGSDENIKEVPTLTPTP